MTGGSETNSDGAPMRPPSPADRPWAHPSEVGLATRGESARRRSSLIATGVVLGGIGLLLSGVLLGSSGDEPGTESATSPPTRRIEASLASVVAVVGGDRELISGVVVDDDGHVLVPTAALSEAEEVWARCGEDEHQLVTEVASDPDHDISVLRLGSTSGRPVRATATPGQGSRAVVLAHSTDDEVVTVRGTLASAEPSDAAIRLTTTAGVAGSDAGAGAPPRFVFDDDGHLLGVTDAGGDDAAGHDVRPAGTLLDAAEHLIDATG